MSQPTSRPHTPPSLGAGAFSASTSGSLRPPEEGSSTGASGGSAASRAAHISTGGFTIASYYQGRYEDEDDSHGASTSTSPRSIGAWDGRGRTPPGSPGRSADGAPGLVRRLSRGSASDEHAGQRHTTALRGGHGIGALGHSRPGDTSIGSADGSLFNPLDFSFDDSPVAALQLDPSLRVVGSEASHRRDESHGSSWSGDMGRYQRHRLHSAGEAGASTPTLPTIAGSYVDYGAPQTAPGGSVLDTPIDFGHDAEPSSRLSSEGAILTANQGYAGWNRYGERDHSDADLPRVAFAEDGSVLRTDSPLQLEDGFAGAERPTHRTPAELNAMAGGDAIQTARTGMQRVGKSLRRISRRVVNLGDHDADDAARGAHLRLPDHDEDSDDEPESFVPPAFAPQPTDEAPRTEMLLRGRSLGLFAPENGFRLAMAKLLAQLWIEPLILVLIVFNVVLLVLQSARNVFKHPRSPGYFDYWEDYALLGVFVVFTVEVLARVVVSGLFINPPPMVYTNPAAGVSGRVDGSEDVAALRDFGAEDHAAQRRRMSRSNTLDAFSELGGSLRNKASSVLKPSLNAHTSDAKTRSSARGEDGVHHHDYAPREPKGVSHPVGGFSGPAWSSRQDTLSSADARSQRRQGTTMLLDNDYDAAFIRKRPLPFAQAILAQRSQTAHYAYLRHSWNRIDFIAVVSFWVAFVLSVARQEQTSAHHIYIFRALSVLRAARLLTITSGTTIILQSLKAAAPLLVNVTYFTAFAMLLFSVIGIQSFRGSYRRQCVWLGGAATGAGAAPGANYTLTQICGGYFDPVQDRRFGFTDTAGNLLRAQPKGYICPAGLVCVQADNPEGGTLSFDNIFAALMQVVVVISSNNWSQTMYDMIDAEPFSSSLYFIVGLLILNFWMANLFVAVVTNTFASLTASTRHSAFAAQKIDAPAEGPSEKEDSARRRNRRRIASVYRRLWGWTSYIWLLAIVADLGAQAQQASYSSVQDKTKLDTIELAFTVAFDVEIMMRWIAFVLDGDWRSFFAEKRNRVDLLLAVVTSIIQIPGIKGTRTYDWLTAFQLARFYRVIAAVPRMEALLTQVLGNLAGLSNMILFLLLSVGLAALVAVQLLRGDVPQEEDGEHIQANFKQIYNGFLGMYQVFTSENWTDVLYAAISNEEQYKQAVFAGILLCGWFLFANFVLLQMFIAALQENMQVAEGQKRQQQLEIYLQRMEAPAPTLSQKILHKLSPYRWLRERNEKRDGSAAGAQSGRPNASDDEKRRRRGLHQVVNPSRWKRTLDRTARLLRLDRPDEHVPLDTIRARQFRQSISGEAMLRDPSRGMSMYEATGEPSDAARLFARERQLTRMRSDLGLSSDEPAQSQINAEHIARYRNDPRIAQAHLVNSHPSYERSLMFFSNTSSFRRFCQSCVPSSHGERIFGRQVSRKRHRVVQVIMFLAIAGSIASAAFATPTYRREWYRVHGFRRDSWFSLVEASLSAIFILEFLLKVVADGLAFTPNAYLLSPWHALDLFVLASLLINTTAELVVIGGVSRFTRAIKAFRALRLINLSALMRNTFHGIVASSGRFLDASLLAILYIVPYAVWGQNLFGGLLYSCNDSGAGISSRVDCVGEFAASPSQWTFLAPRVWQNPTEGSQYSFDDFRSALLILFEVVSLEGWISVMTAAMAIVGRDMQSSPDATQVNALFFVIYNLIGAVFVLTLFVSVLLEQFRAFSGAAFQTTEQRQWIDLQRLIARQRPSKRPKVKPGDPLRAWCYERATRKHGWWSRLLTFLYVGNIVVMATQRFQDSASAEQTRDIVYIGLTACYALDIVIRLAGLGWRAYKDNWWNLYDLVVVTGTFATTIPLLAPDRDTATGIVQAQKLFLVAIAFKLVQKSNALNQLFRTAVASLPAIGSTFALWLVLFITFAIVNVEVFGLTRWGANETYAKNFSTFFGSLVFLSMTSTGEGWNQYMHDYMVEPPNCTPASNYLETDCGSKSWALALFIAWNVISMYLFLNLLTGQVVENFSYVFQLGGEPMLSREQLRAYKKVWAEFDTSRKGYVARDKIVPLLNRLTGVFDVRVYPPEGRISALRAAAARDGPLPSPSTPTKGRVAAAASEALTRLRGGSPSPLPVDDEGKPSFAWPPSSQRADCLAGLDVGKLRAALGRLDLEDIKHRRRRFERIYHEVCLREDPEKGGIAFTELLYVLAHHKLIDDESALGLEELIERRMLLERIETNIELERVRLALRGMHLRHRLHAMRAAHEQAESPPVQTDSSLPTINVQDPAGVSAPRQRPPLRLNIADIDSGYAYQRDAAPSSINTGSRSPGQGALTPSSSALHLSPHSSPRGTSAHDAATPAITVSSADPFMRHGEDGATPSTESFQQTAWADLARRLSREVHEPAAYARSREASPGRSWSRDGHGAHRSRSASPSPAPSPTWLSRGANMEATRSADRADDHAFGPHDLSPGASPSPRHDEHDSRHA